MENKDAFEILNFYPSKSTGNMLGFASLKSYRSVNGELVAEATKIKIMRNSFNGHVFFSYHDEKYIAKDGTEKYNQTTRTIEKEGYEKVQKEFGRAWDAYIRKTQPTAHTASIGQHNNGGSYYPHGLVQNQAPIQNSVQELPF